MIHTIPNTETYPLIWVISISSLRCVNISIEQVFGHRSVAIFGLDKTVWNFLLAVNVKQIQEAINTIWDRLSSHEDLVKQLEGLDTKGLEVRVG